MEQTLFLEHAYCDLPLICRINLGRFRINVSLNSKDYVIQLVLDAADTDAIS
jgi:hypothetical protein